MCARRKNRPPQHSRTGAVNAGRGASYQLSGSGADSLLGTVSGGGGVTTLGGALTTSGENWSALGPYGCTADGYLRVTIAGEQLDVPIDCTTGG
jgi:hypothetical protein